MTELQRLQLRIDRLREQGLSDIKFSGPTASECAVEDFAGEANAMFESIERGKVRPLRFNDSMANPPPTIAKPVIEL